ncbi:MAG: Mrp/NBP35 family ATP-binding protein [Clostridia bacterium]|nr:Mrp/NBP35 family ATP-binding protein [Clostridia bacterium]
MSEECNHDCGSCSAKCAEKDTYANKNGNVKKVIGVVSGKGGVGKSLVTSLLAVAAEKCGYKTGVLDADITGPSIPKIFGLDGPAMSNPEGILPSETKTGIRVMSINLLLDNQTDPVIWRGPMIAGTVQQFWTDVIWGDLDIMFIDMPPGTGDVPLTVFQSIPVDGIVVVTSPQELVSMIVAKAVNMANAMNVPVVGVVENMSYFLCLDNGKSYKVFGESHIDQVADEYGLQVLAKIPLNPNLSEACDRGCIEDYENDLMADALKVIDKMPARNTPKAKK